MLSQVMIDMNVCTCDLCDHQWRSEEVPARCAKCKSTAWNRNEEKEAPFVMTETQQNVKRKVELAEKQPIVHKASKRESVADQPAIKRQSREKKAKSAGKSGYCPHKFIQLEDGSTNCPQCKTGA